MNISLPDIPGVFPVEYSFFFFSLSFLAAAALCFNFFFFQATKVCRVILVSLEESSLDLSVSISSSIVITASSLSFFNLSFFSTNPLGSACLYLQACPDLTSGHSQNQPYFAFSTASRKCLQMMSVSLEASAPCFLTTSASLSSSHSSMSSLF